MVPGLSTDLSCIWTNSQSKTQFLSHPSNSTITIAYRLMCNPSYGRTIPVFPSFENTLYVARTNAVGFLSRTIYNLKSTAKLANILQCS
jgi:hypothetical protein